MSRNLIISPLLLSVLLLSLPSRAVMVVYTDYAQPPAGVTGDTRVSGSMSRNNYSSRCLAP